MKIPISMFCPLLPELAALPGADDVAEPGEVLLVLLAAALPLFEVLATPPRWW